MLENGDIVFENYRYDYTSSYQFYKVSEYNGKTALLTPIAHRGGSRGPFGIGSDEVEPIPDVIDGSPVRKRISPEGEFVPARYKNPWTSTHSWSEAEKKKELESPEYDLSESIDFDKVYESSTKTLAVRLSEYYEALAPCVSDEEWPVLREAIQKLRVIERSLCHPKFALREDDYQARLLEDYLRVAQFSGVERLDEFVFKKKDPRIEELEAKIRAAQEEKKEAAKKAKVDARTAKDKARTDAEIERLEAKLRSIDPKAAEAVELDSDREDAKASTEEIAKDVAEDAVDDIKRAAEEGASVPTDPVTAKAEGDALAAAINSELAKAEKTTDEKAKKGFFNKAVDLVKSAAKKGPVALSTIAKTAGPALAATGMGVVTGAVRGLVTGGPLGVVTGAVSGAAMGLGGFIGSKLGWNTPVAFVDWQISRARKKAAKDPKYATEVLKWENIKKNSKALKAIQTVLGATGGVAGGMAGMKVASNPLAFVNSIKNGLSSVLPGNQTPDLNETRTALGAVAGASTAAVAQTVAGGLVQTQGQPVQETPVQQVAPLEQPLPVVEPVVPIGIEQPELSPTSQDMGLASAEFSPATVVGSEVPAEVRGNPAAIAYGRMPGAAALAPTVTGEVPEDFIPGLEELPQEPIDVPQSPIQEQPPLETAGPETPQGTALEQQVENEATVAAEEAGVRPEIAEEAVPDAVDAVETVADDGQPHSEQELENAAAQAAINDGATPEEAKVVGEEVTNEIVKNGYKFVGKSPEGYNMYLKTDTVTLDNGASMTTSTGIIDVNNDDSINQNDIVMERQNMRYGNFNNVTNKYGVVGAGQAPAANQAVVQDQSAVQQAPQVAPPGVQGPPPPVAPVQQAAPVQQSVSVQPQRASAPIRPPVVPTVPDDQIPDPKSLYRNGGETPQSIGASLATNNNPNAIGQLLNTAQGVYGGGGRADATNVISNALKYQTGANTVTSDGYKWTVDGTVLDRDQVRDVLLSGGQQQPAATVASTPRFNPNGRAPVGTL